MHRTTPALALLLAACVPDAPEAPGADDDPVDTDGTPADGDGLATGPAPLRRLSAAELANALEGATGLRPAEALARLPVDRRDLLFDRIADAQTVSAVHVEAFDALAEAVARTLIEGRRLDELAPACADGVVPGWLDPTTVAVAPAAMSESPGWGWYPDAEPPYTLYAPHVVLSTTFDAPAAGTYALAWWIDAEHESAWPWVEVRVGGDDVLRVHAGPGRSAIDATFTVDGAGPVLVELDLSGDGVWENDVVRVGEATFTGPVEDDDPGTADARATCAADLARTLATRAWRRPATHGEVDALVALFEAGRSTGRDAHGLRMVIEAVLTSPWFLYLVELGEPSSPETLTPWELASRLSFALCEAPPDEDLRAAAASGALRDPAVLRTQSARLLDSPCGRATVARFHHQWLDLDALDGLARDPAYYPAVGPELGPALREGTDAFLEALIFDEDASLQRLWSDPAVYADERTGWVYDVDAGPGLDRFEPGRRAGLLTQASVLAATSKFAQTSPVLRGAFVHRRLLCGTLRPPPADVDASPPPLDDTLTTRERWARHSADPACAGCHATLDPVGFALEGYDAVGHVRTEEHGAPVDTTGSVPALGGAPVDGGVALAELVAASDALHACFARQLLRDGLGRLERPEDLDALAVVEAASRSSVREAVLALVTSDAFRRRLPEDTP